MTHRIATITAVLAVLAAPALAGDITVRDAYARSANPKSGAAFMVIENAGTTDDRLIEVRSDAAARTELHTHIENADGVMRMVEVEDGFPVPAGGMAMLRRGGDHVMFMGLTEPLDDGDSVSVTLTFEGAGDIEVEIPVDNSRAPAGHGG